MSPSGPRNVVSIEQVALYRTPSRFAPDASSPSDETPWPRRATILGLPARKPVLSLRDTLAGGTPDRLDAA